MQSYFLNTKHNILLQKSSIFMAIWTRHTAYIVKDFCMEISNHKTLIIYFQSQITASGCETKKGSNTCSFCQFIILILLHVQRQMFLCSQKHYFVSLLVTMTGQKSQQKYQNLQGVICWPVLTTCPGLPWWSSGWEFTCWWKFNPWCRTMPYATGQLSLFSTTPEPMCPRTHAPQQEKPPQWEACAPWLESSSNLPQLKKACAKQGRPNALKNK